MLTLTQLVPISARFLY